jgi:hypothetical protein
MTTTHYTIDITERPLDARAPFLIQIMGKHGVLDYRWAHSRESAETLAHVMRSAQPITRSAEIRWISS